MAKKKIEVENLRHNDTRPNIPTHELRDFLSEEERRPGMMLYPRDPSLDPQLVWKGKDEQDAQELAVPVLPIYIQEKIHPQAIVEEVRAHSVRQEGIQQMSLFGDFGEPDDFEQLIEFYKHRQNWTNRMILGDSLAVMTSLAEKEGLKGQVQMIFLDPPYGIKFGSNWQVSTRKREVKDGKVEDATRQPEQIRAFRDTWQMGIHSYLSYLRDRLVTARELLTESGSIFVQIGDENVHLVRSLLDEVFGSENFIALINFRSMMPLASGHIESVFDYVIWYGKLSSALKYRNLWTPKNVGGDSEFVFANTMPGYYRKLSKEEIENISVTLGKERVFKRSDLASSGYTPSCTFPINFQKLTYLPVKGKSWRTMRAGIDCLIKADRLFSLGEKLYFKMYHDDFGYKSLENSWSDTIAFEQKNYVVQTTTTVVQRCMLMATDPGDLVLDPTCGSGTTAYVAEQWGRRWITIDTSRVAIALARTRLMAAKYPYYLLSDSDAGINKEMELTGRMPPEYRPTHDLKKGFVYRTVPHITLKDIANNPEIDDLHAEYQELLEPLRAKLNQLTGQNWEEWEIPRDIGKGWSKEVLATHEEYWQLRRERQQKIDASIAYHSETEILYDQPYEDNSRVRVSGPFTVESLQPHRVIAPDEHAARPESERQDDRGQFVAMILENLAKAGVQNTIKNERLKFDFLEPYAGKYLHAVGEYTGADEVIRRVAVHIGPEHSTITALDIKEAAKEAVMGVGFHSLIICGFAFDPDVSEQAKRYGDLTVLPTRMNPDLAMGDSLLKKTGSGNLFMVFGEPDLSVHQNQDGQWVVQIHGLDIYDPTTGQIRNNSTDDIACWFIDTHYNGESFFVRHAYFTGADEPYEKLKKALRAEIDEDLWSTLYSTTSFPFDTPETGKIAVKVINHYGDEVLKVYEVGA